MKYRYNVSEAFKNSCKSNIGLNRYGRIHVVEDDLDIIGENYSGQLVDFTIEDNCYVNNTFIGTTVAKKITVNILNPDNSINLENKTIEAFVGIYINDKLEEIPYGTYIIEKPENEEVKQRTSFTGYDYMIKFNVPYKDRVTYPIKASALFEDVCNQVGLKVGNIDYTNADYMILGNPFTNNEDCRTVLSNIAQLAGGFAKIGRDNKVYIVSLKNLSDLLTVKDVHFMTVQELNLIPVKRLSNYSENSDEKLDGNNYFDDFAKNEQWGEVNSIILRISGTEGENTVIQDDENIKENGITELVIEDNLFLISQREREKVIEPLWNSLKGIKYLPFKTEYYGYPYLDSGDLIYIEDTKDTGHISYIFNHKFTFNGSFKGNLETPAMTKTQTAYKNIFNTKTKFKQTERKIDKINGVISDIVEEQTETSQKLTEHEQTIDSIQNTVNHIEELTNTITGLKTITLENCIAGDLVELHIYGNNTVFDYLYPSDDLYPANDLFPYGDSRIIITNEEGTSVIYELGVNDVLRQNGEIKDEYILQNGKAQVIRRINKSGTIKTKEVIEDLGDYAIELFEGKNTIIIQNYTAQITAKYVVKNSLIDVYATRVEMHSSIEETAEEINLEVSKKVGEDEVVSKINQSAEQIQIDANKISLARKRNRFNWR